VGPLLKAGPIACNNGLVRITRLNSEEVTEAEAWKQVEEETTAISAAIDWMRSMLLVPKGSAVTQAIHQLKATALVCNELCKQDKEVNRVYTEVENKLFFWTKRSAGCRSRLSRTSSHDAIVSRRWRRRRRRHSVFSLT
jgi:hypothetical protein